MNDLLQCGWISLHLAGIVLAWFVRAPDSTSLKFLPRGTVQALFLVVLVLVAGLAVVGNCLDWSVWTFSAVTLSVMLVTCVSGNSSQHSGLTRS